MGYQAGDVPCGDFYLRLTMGALAEISERLDAPGPAELAAKFRANDEAFRTALIACLRPCHPAPENAVLSVSDADGEAALSKLFVAAFTKEKI